MSNEHPNAKDFSLMIQVQQSDIDELEHANNVAYVRWIQDVAAAHWNSVASAEEKQKYVWVVLRHEIDYLSPAFRNDTVLAITWVGQSIGPRSDRFVLLTNKATGKLLAKAKTTWCLLDGTTKRPKRIEEAVITLLTQVNI